MKLAFRPQIFEKHSNIRLHENVSTGNQGVPNGRTDRHDKAISRFSQFCESAYTESGSRLSTKFTPTAFSKIFLKDGLKKEQQSRHTILVQSANSMEDSPSSEADSLSASQDIYLAFYGNLIFIALFKIALHLPLFSAK